jgi:hypothetical protein
MAGKWASNLERVLQAQRQTIRENQRNRGHAR